MSSLVDILIIVAVIAFQTFSGYIGNRYLGAILPIMFLAFVGFFIFKGAIDFNFKDIIMPFIGIIVLIGIYEGGRESKKNKVKKELDKMKAKDILNKD